MHVQLTKGVSDKMLVLSGRSGKSVNELVNILLGSIDEVKFEEEISLVISQKLPVPEPSQRPPTRIVRRINWSAKL